VAESVLFRGGTIMRLLALGILAGLAADVLLANAAQQITPEMFASCNARWRQHRDGSSTAKDTDFAGFIQNCYATYGQPQAGTLSYVANTQPPDAFLSLRTEPASSRGQRVMAMPNGTLLDVQKRQPDGWWYVQVVPTGEIGWVLSGAGDKKWIECCKAMPPNDKSVASVEPQPFSNKPSFNCATAKSPSARLICSDNEVSKQDGDLAEKFKAAMASRPDEISKKQLRNEQLLWIRERNNRCGLGPDKVNVPTPELSAAKPCLAEAIGSRRDALALLIVKSGPVADASQVAPSETAVANSAKYKKCSDTTISCIQACNDDATCEASCSSAFAICKKDLPASASTIVAPVFVNAEQIDVPSNSRSECKILNEAPALGDLVWEGGCKDGYASGSGTAKWMMDGAVRYTQTYGEDRGILREKGSVVVAKEAIDKSIKITAECNDRGALVTILVKRNFALDSPGLVNYLLSSRGQAYAWEHCETSKWNRFTIIILYDDDPNRGPNNPVSARPQYAVGPSAPEKTVWAEYINWPAQFAAERNKRLYDNEIGRRQQLAFQQAAQEQASRVAAAKQAVRARVAADLGFQEFVQAGDLSTNPFRYKGKVVAFLTMFVRMTAENEAVFSQFGAQVARGVPSTAFTTQGQMVILSMRVVGNTDDKSAVLGEFVGAYKCVQNNCFEYFDSVN
jgi:uncharacterized protein YecT (DUF1311 family)